jgi:hypothetical protein
MRQDALGRLLAFWFVMMILALVLGFEFLILKLHHLRRAHHVLLRKLEQVERRTEKLEKQAGPARDGVADKTRSEA